MTRSLTNQGDPVSQDQSRRNAWALKAQIKKDRLFTSPKKPQLCESKQSRRRKDSNDTRKDPIVYTIDEWKCTRSPLFISPSHTFPHTLTFPPTPSLSDHLEY